MQTFDHSQLRADDLQRINVVGTSGSGKTRFSRQLAEILNSLLVDMDRLNWSTDWTEVEIPVLRDRLSGALAADRWVVDGNYHSKTRDIKWRDVTLVIWIDTSFLHCLAGAETCHAPCMESARDLARHRKQRVISTFVYQRRFDHPVDDLLISPKPETI